MGEHKHVMQLIKEMERWVESMLLDKYGAKVVIKWLEYVYKNI